MTMERHVLLQSETGDLSGHVLCERARADDVECDIDAASAYVVKRANGQQRLLARAERPDEHESKSAGGRCGRPVWVEDGFVDEVADHYRRFARIEPHLVGHCRRNGDDVSGLTKYHEMGH